MSATFPRLKSRVRISSPAPFRGSFALTVPPPREIYSLNLSGVAPPARRAGPLSSRVVFSDAFPQAI